MFYLIILFSAISWRVTKAYPSLSELKEVNIAESENQTMVTINLSKSTKVVPYLKGTENCIVLEFDKAIISEDLKKKAFASRDIKLAYLSVANNESNKDKDKNTKIKQNKKVKAKIFYKADCLPSVKYSKDKVALKLSVKDNLAKALQKPSNTLLHPNEEKYAPVVISLEDAPFKPVVSEIASQAGMDLKFKGNMPETFSIELQSEDPFEAICAIAVKTKMKFYRDGKIWYLEGEA